MSAEVIFEAVVTGHRPPYRWKLFRTEDGGKNRTAVSPCEVPVEGEAVSFQDACFEARDAARVAYDVWLHAHVKQTVEVFRGPKEITEPELEPEEKPKGPPMLDRARLDPRGQSDATG